MQNPFLQQESGSSAQLRITPIAQNLSNRVFGDIQKLMPLESDAVVHLAGNSIARRRLLASKMLSGTSSCIQINNSAASHKAFRFTQTFSTEQYARKYAESHSISKPTQRHLKTHSSQ